MSAISSLAAQTYLPPPAVSARNTPKVDRDGDGDHNAPDVKPAASPSAGPNALLRTVA